MRQLTVFLCVAALAIARSLSADEPSGTFAWRTLAGHQGGTGNSDGVGTAARFWYPGGVAVDSQGNAFVADTYNNTIRKVANNGVVSTLAGSPGAFGVVDGTNGGARFNGPAGVAVDLDGNVYVADTGNSLIRKVSPSGVVSTVAGAAGQQGAADGIGGAARFSSPLGVAVGRDGVIYVADSGNSTIRKISPGAVVTTLAGMPGDSGSDDGIGDAARFYYPCGVAVDSATNVYVADTDNSTVRKISSVGMVTTLAGSAGNFGSSDGTNSAAQFYYPAGLAVDNSGNLYVADTYNSIIRKITSDGLVTTLSGSSTETGARDGVGTDARFAYPAGVAVGTNGSLYVADSENSLLRTVSCEGAVTTIAGSVDGSGTSDASGAQAGFNQPFGLAADGNGILYVVDTLNSTLRRVTTGGGLVSTVAGKPGATGSVDDIGEVARFNNPFGVAVRTGGIVYVADTRNNTIRKVGPDGAVSTFAGSAGQAGSLDETGTAARFSFPLGMASDSLGNLYVADFNSNIIRKVTSSGVVTTLAGTAGARGSANGQGTAASFNGPFGLAVSAAGDIYVSDSGNNTIRKVTADGWVRTLAGSAGQVGSLDGVSNSARFFYPAGVAVDHTGNLVVADSGNSTVRNVALDGTVTTLAGSPGHTGSLDGTGTAARFFAPFGVTTDQAGNVYVADSQNSTIRRVTPGGEVTTLAGLAGQSGSADVSTSLARFSGPGGVVVDLTGNVFVADTDNSTIRRLSPDGAVLTVAGSAATPGSNDGLGIASRFWAPTGLALDSLGTLYIADSYNNTVRKLDPTGMVTTLAGSPFQAGSADGQGSQARFQVPTGLALDHFGSVYVADSGNSIVRLISSNGNVTTVAGRAGEPGIDDGSLGSARLNHPNGVAVDKTGNLYVADSGNCTLRMVTPDGTVTTLAGSPGQPGNADGAGSDARFVYPADVVVDSQGNIYVADPGNSTIRHVTTNGWVTTIGGMAGVIGGLDGVGTLATFANPAGIAVGSGGAVYVADTGNNRIVRGLRLPMLRVTGSQSGVTVFWPSTTAASFALEQATGISAWSLSTNGIVDDGTNRLVTVAPVQGAQFFRLVAP